MLSERNEFATIAAEWLQRRSEAIEDARSFYGFAFTHFSPFDVLRAQQHWAANAWLRLVDDTTAMQATVEQTIGLARGLGLGLDALQPSAAARTASETRAAGRPLREAFSDQQAG
jgi:hypothetical protein